MSSSGDVVVALGPAFAAGFGLQMLLEIFDPILSRLAPDPTTKKLFTNAISLVVGLAMAFGAGLTVLMPLGLKNVSPIVDGLVTGLVVSGGTEGFNSIMKFLGYAKEAKGQAAGLKAAPATPAATTGNAG